LAAGLCADPLGELMRFPRPLATMGDLFIRGGGKETEGRGYLSGDRGRREATEREGREFPPK